MDRRHAYLGSGQVNSLLFPARTINYQKLIQDFAEAVRLELDQQTITAQEGDVNGEMMGARRSVAARPKPCCPPATGT